MKEGNLHTVVKTPSLLRVALFRFDSTKHNDIVDAKIGHIDILLISETKLDDSFSSV